MNKGQAFVAAGVAALGAYGFVATLQPDADFGRILAAYGGICLVGVSVIMYAPRAGVLDG